ncbi:ABC transporter substrate-binding protein [Streptomyces umbrinus]|uniref:ABC transporter substrate-binding protein n=1 Tax=Streptomyces umbrinus TaxID=67370 RepID=UPI00167C9DF6|nr:ABC transporter substrate-binding protein [Streptomyces umbrinus]MCR3725982.1 iron complex transport system substrate-binding protein [Streptomyces umbrinus]GHH49991.1 ABC transporter substrate-binding protein [Streptomyces umbrinus]
MGWEFTDDRGITLRRIGRPERVAAYVRAGAALWDLGVRPVGVYGSGHDGDEPDRAKSGALADVPYLGAGKGLDDGAIRSVRPDIVVDVTYDRDKPYAVTEAAAKRAGAPVLALAVGGDTSLPNILARFDQLAVALGGEPAGGDSELAAAEDAVRSAASVPLKVLALSAAGARQVHLARPGTWPELRHLAELGVELVEPGDGGANWATTTWERALGLAPDLVLADARANAVPAGELESVPAWEALTATATVEPWNPELPCSAHAYAAFLRSVADALEVLGAKR